VNLLPTKSRNTTNLLPVDIQHAKEKYVVPYFGIGMAYVSHEYSTGCHEERKMERKNERKEDGMFS